MRSLHRISGRRARCGLFLAAVSLLPPAARHAAAEEHSKPSDMSLFTFEKQQIAFQYFDAIMQIPNIQVSFDGVQERGFKQDMAAAIVSSLADRFGDQNHRPSHEEAEAALDWLYSAYGLIADKYYGDHDGVEEREEVERFNEAYPRLVGLDRVIDMIRRRRMDYDVFTERWYRAGP